MASSAAVASTSILHSLPPRPPTPPREANHDADVSLRSLVKGRPQPFDPRRSLQTPPGTHSPASSHPSSIRARKKVEWSNHTEYKDPPQYSDAPSLDSLPPLSVTPSASSKPLKGILKHSPSPNPLASALGAQLDGGAAQPNIIEMLDSTIKQLAGPDRHSKLDAYMMLARALKASNNLPDRVALQSKMSLFMQFIQRDITSKKPDGALDSSLVNHALTLLATFLHFPAIAFTMTSDFGLHVVDHATRSFEDASVPKDVVRHFMQVIAFQNFSPKVMTPDRVGRLVAALHNIEHHLTGKSIVMSRLHIYKRLVKQARGSMLTHSDWLKDMFTDMLSTVKDIRAQAISLGTEAGFALRHDKVLFRKVAEVFRATSDDETYIEFYVKRLELMTKDKQTCSAVPQIWSVVILFLRCPLDRWQHYGPWLTIVQSAFNMTDSPTKQEANYAWNRYVYLSILDSKMPSKGIATLCQPLLSQLRRKTNPKQQEESMKLRRVVIGVVCSLYHYALAQGDDKYPTHTIWDVAIQPVMEQLISLDGKPDYPGDCMMQAARMLVGLLDVSTPRPPRNPERIMDAAPLVPEELLPIDCKWVRRNCDRVLQAVWPILEKRFVDLANKESLVFRLWQALVGSVAAASAKDIKVSDDTARFLAGSFNLLSKVWAAGLGGDNGSANAKFLASVEHFVNLLTDGLRVLPFTEKKFSLGLSNTFEPVSTPSQRLDKTEKPRGVLRTPLQHLFAMLCSTPPGCADDDELASLFQSVFEPFVKGRSAKGGVELSRELIQLLPRNALSPFGPWLLAAEYTKASLDKGLAGSGSTGTSGKKLLGPQYRDVVSLLERGLACHPNLPAAHWHSLFDLVSATVAQEFGDAGRALVVIEPLAKALLDNLPSGLAKPSTISVQAMKTLFHVARLPRDRQALDTARLRLWGAPPAAAKAGSSDPFDNLYKLGNQAMELFYDKYTDLDAPAEVDAFAEAVGLFVERCLSQSMVRTVSKMQHGLCPWIRDERTRLKPHEESSMSKTLRQLWDRVCTELVSHGRLEKDEFVQIEPLLAAAFKSRHAHIVNKAVGAWNALVEDEDEAECSDGFLSMISSLRSRVDIIVPGAADPPSGGFGAQAFSFIGHPDDESLVALSSATSRHDSNQATAAAASTSKRPTTRKRRMETTAEIREIPGKRTSTSRPRHDNSQVQFATIAPSSPSRDESQHLTDHQKEVRERQRESAALFLGMRSSSPGFAGTAQRKEKGAEDGSAECLAKDTTPKHESYDDLIRSTPTPRRGQLLPMDDINDPPSSPPVPRPYPLLSEIQSRSRASSSLENWEFSSSTGSPVARPRQASHDGEPAPAALREQPSPPRGCAPTGEKRRSANSKEQETAKVIPSSITDDDGSVAGGQTEDGAVSPSPAEPPATPPLRHLVPPSEVRETPMSGEDEFADARSSPERSSPRRGQASIMDAHSGDAAKDTSFALSEGVESRMVELVVELESRRYELPMTRGDSSPEKESEAEEQESNGRTAAHAISPSPTGPITRRESKRLASLTGPSTPAEGKAKGKRKRSGTKLGGGRGRKRRCAESKVEGQANDELKTGPPAPTRSHSTRHGSGMQTRRSSRKQNRGIANAEDSEAAGSPEGKEAAPEKPSPGGDIGDTDEEVMSQLVTESFAASQQGQSQQSAKAAGRVARRATAKDAASPCEHVDATRASKASAEARGEQASGGGDKRPGIMEALRGGLAQLRSAALSRDEVYELEDILMDMRRELYEAERRGRRRKQRGA